MKDAFGVERGDIAKGLGQWLKAGRTYGYMNASKVRRGNQVVRDLKAGGPSRTIGESNRAFARRQGRYDDFRATGRARGVL
jgi:hypothetical protein